MSWVVDASVAAKWFFEEEGTGAARALIASGEALVAPDLVLPEVCNIGWRRARAGEIPAEQARAVAEALPRVLSLVVPVAEVLDRAVDLALRLDHPVYDCVYLALAEARNLPLVTADRRLLDRAAAGGWRGSAVQLADS